MALPDSPLTRGEQYLAKAAGQDVALPNVPLTRAEQYLNKIATGEGTVPNVPLTRIEQYLAYIAENGGGGNPNTQQTVAGTAATPWGDVSYSTLAAALYDGNAHAVMMVQMGDAAGQFSLLATRGGLIYAGNANIGTTIADSIVAELDWNDNGSINYIRSISGGQIQDYTAYAAGIETFLTIYWHPMPEGGD